jgi:hypothetical protein
VRIRAAVSSLLVGVAACFPQVDLGLNPDGSTAAGGGGSSLGGGSTADGGGAMGGGAMGGGSAMGGGDVSGGGSAVGGGLAAGGGAATGGGSAATGGGSGGGIVANLPPYCTDAGWCYENPLPFGLNLNGVWALSDDEAWFVGDHGFTLHYLNGTFGVAPTATPFALNAVAASRLDPRAGRESVALGRRDVERHAAAGLEPVGARRGRRARRVRRGRERAGAAPEALTRFAEASKHQPVWSRGGMAQRPPDTLSIVRQADGDHVHLPALAVRVRDPRGRESSAPLGIAPVVIGSGVDCSVVVDDPRVSRRHYPVKI